MALKLAKKRMDERRGVTPQAPCIEHEVTDVADLPDDVDVLKQTIMQLLASNAQLNERLAYLLRRRYGPQSEKLDPAQLELFSKEIEALLSREGEAAEPPASRPDRGRRKPTGRRPIPAHLPRVRQDHVLDDELIPCPTCGEQRIVIGRKRSEQIEYVPPKLIVIEHVAHTYACRSCAGEIETASKPQGPIDKCLAGSGLLAHVIVSKFDDHLPLYRQEEIFKRNGIDINRSTMCGWLLGCSQTLEPLYKLMHARIHRSRVIQTDGTGLPLIERGRGSTRSSGFWVYRGDDRAPYVAYDFTRHQDRAGPERWLKGFSGTLQADASSLYDVFFDERRFGTRVTEAGCWAHARRYFEKAKVQHPAEAMTAMAWISKLYAIEDRAREMSHRRRRKLRRREARRVLAGFEAWIRTIAPRALPKSLLGKAVAYLRRHWTALNCYVDNGRISIDNNASERAIRPMTVGRKNWLFAGSDDGGRATAVLFTMIESAKRAGADITEWLADVLERINRTAPTELGELLPDRWKLLRENRSVRAAHARRRRAALAAPTSR